MERVFLKTGTWIRLSDGECYRITDKPLGEGGGSLVYPCERIRYTDHEYTVSTTKYALKECYPISSQYEFVRDSNGEIVPQKPGNESEKYLQTVKQMQLNEFSKAETIYNTSLRMIPVLSAADHVSISLDNGESFSKVNNAVSVMPSLEFKGNSLRSYLNEGNTITATKALQLTKLILLAVKEIHEAGFIHLDIQDGNIFVKGSLGDEDIVSLIDFGSARELQKDGLCDVITDGVIFSTQGFSAPEIVEGNDGSLRLGREADIYSIGYTLLLMLTGKKYTQRELLSLDMNFILSGRKIKKLNCPNYMANRLRQILEKALKKSPEERYHDCNEMLEDITSVLEALIPYQTTLSQVVYDAFICYRHGDIDSPVSKYLQEKLEHFHCPKGTGTGKKRIGKVFVDEGELSSCADFGLQIREALKNTEWLIVICSAGTKESPWVNLEIRTFLEYHDRSHILAVITEGEPEDVFPDELRGNNAGKSEVFAADARGSDLTQIKRKIKIDSVLRIAAPILNVPFDALKQRKKRYLLQRAGISAAAVLLLLNAFILYSMNKNMEIREKNREIQINTARNYLTQAESLLKKGKIRNSLNTLLSIPNDTDQPVLSEETYILNSALHKYYHQENSEGFRPDQEVELDEFSDTDIKVSIDGNIIFLLDETGTAVFYDTEDFSVIWKYQMPDKNGDEGLERFMFGEFLSEQEFLLVTMDEIIHLNPLTQTVESENLPEGYKIFTKGECTYRNGVLALIGTNNNEYEIYTHNYNDNSTKVVTIPQPQGFAEYSIVKSFKIFLSPDGTSIAIINGSEVSPMMAYDSEKPSGLLILDLDTEKSELIHTDHFIYQLEFISGAEIATIEYDFSESVTKDLGDEKARYYQNVYDYKDGKSLQSYSHYYLEVYADELATIPFIAKSSEISAWGAGLSSRDEMKQVIFLCFGKHLLLIDQEDYSVLIEKTFDRNIKEICVYQGDEIIVGLSDGSVGCLRNGFYIKIFSIQTDVSQVIFNSEKEMLIQILTSEKTMIISRNEIDDSMEPVTDDEFSSPRYEQEEEIHAAENGRYAVLKGEAIEVYDEDRIEPLLSIPVSPSQTMPLFSFFRHDTQIIVYTHDNCLSLWDIDTGEMLSYRELDSSLWIKSYIITDPEGVFFALHQNEGVITYDTDTFDIQMKETNVFYVDDENQIVRYADIPYGFVDFEEGLIYSKSRRVGGCYYSAPFMTYSELKEEAKKD